MNSPIPYFGGKSRAAAAIIERLPEHKTYAEVFGGAAWSLFKKPPSRVEILNDLDRRLMNFYRVTKYHLEPLVEEIAGLQPGRDFFYLLREELERPTLTDIQRARPIIMFSGQPSPAGLKIPAWPPAPGGRSAAGPPWLVRYCRKWPNA